MFKKVKMLSNGKLGIEFSEDEIIRHCILNGDKIDISDMLIERGNNDKIQNK